jgi:hypothetical protein
MAANLVAGTFTTENGQMEDNLTKAVMHSLAEGKNSTVLLTSEAFDAVDMVINRLRAGGISDIVIRNTLVVKTPEDA